MTPINNHNGKYNEDVVKNFIENTIKPPHVIIPKIGNTGENGTLKGLGLSGSVFLKIKTAMQIIINDVNVPKLHNSADMFKSINNAHITTTIPEIQVKTCGVLYFLCINLKDLGKNLSLLIAYKILVVPN